MIRQKTVIYSVIIDIFNKISSHFALAEIKLFKY